MRPYSAFSKKTILFVLPLIIIGIFILIAKTNFPKASIQKEISQTKRTNIERCSDCNIIFISFDPLKASHVSSLGYNKITTPTIDEFANKSFNFTNAVSVTSWTLPSVMSLFTSLYPSQHKVINKYVFNEFMVEEIANLSKVKPRAVTLAQVLNENGYRTGGFTGGAADSHIFGLNQGFDVYVDDKDFAGIEYAVPFAIDWIKEHKDEKLFVFLQGYNTHGQYIPSGGFDKRFVDFDYKGKLTGSGEEQKSLREEGVAKGQLFLSKDDVRFLVDLYDEKIQRADEQLAKFINEYNKLGLQKRTIFIITSGHGDEFYEHGGIDHGHSLYDEQIKVPLVINMPNMKQGKKINNQVRSIDIMPTIFDLVNIKVSESVNKQMSGTSLIPIMRGEQKKLDAFLETDYRYATFQRAIRTFDGWKLITNLETGSYELYNLNRDPREKNNLFNNSPEQAKKLKNTLNKFYKISN